jgi:hypothetical protein
MCNLVSANNSCVIIYYALSMLYIISITYFFKQYFIILPLFMNLSVFYFYFYVFCDFMYLFIAFELTSVMVGFMYILSDFKKSYNTFAINLILLNFFNFILAVLFLSFFYQYYGTTNLFYIVNLYDGSLEEYFVLTLLNIFILFKVGHLPSFFIKCDIYSKMPLSFLLSYTFFYLVFIIPVCAFFTLFIYNTIGCNTVFTILFFFTSLFSFTILNRYAYTDFLVSSTVIFTTFITILLFS